MVNKAMEDDKIRNFILIALAITDLILITTAAFLGFYVCVGYLCILPFLVWFIHKLHHKTIEHQVHTTSTKLIFWGNQLLNVLMIIFFFVELQHFALIIGIVICVVQLGKSVYLTHESKFYKTFKYVVVSSMILGFFMCSNAIFWKQDALVDPNTLKCDHVINFTSKNDTINIATKNNEVIMGDLKITSGKICLNIASFNRGFIVKQGSTKAWTETCDAITFETKG